MIQFIAVWFTPRAKPRPPAVALQLGGMVKDIIEVPDLEGFRRSRARRLWNIGVAARDLHGREPHAASASVEQLTATTEASKQATRRPHSQPGVTRPFGPIRRLPSLVP